MNDWLDVLTGLRANETPCVLITVTEAKGSTPREAGTKMVVTAEKQFGTIGGGNLEFESIVAARKLLSAAVSGPQAKDYPLGPALAQCCGGHVTVLLEPFATTRKKVLLFGAGHVGREVVKVLDELPISVIWVDERAEEFPAAIPRNCKKIITTRPIGKLKEATETTYIVVMTHDHALDFEIVKAALEHGSFAYLGLIGSKTKSARFRKRLQALELDTQRLVCPIGIKGVTGKHPREIAIALAAELLTLGLTPCTEEQEEEKAV
ncbi:MAG: xanthine dehydrogenase accessory protein XdhC [Alphaproteobacteria bacterium]|nr:xanthine dehydrogenase accessory protein XdhC [Alphaproteobacteria bacterium]MDE2337267.1 xanthine dehydrogenase accessory protein XdhC [Alphaproteobacteria bacterium]